MCYTEFQQSGLHMKHKGGFIMWNRIDLKVRGKLSFTRNYWSAVVAALVMAIFTGGSYSRYGSKAADTYDSFHDYGSFHMSGSESMMFAMFALMAAAVAGIISLLFIIVKIFVGNLLLVGGSRFFIENQTGNPGVGVIGSTFQGGQYMNIVVTMFLKGLFIGLWSLLFVVPGIIKHYEYLMIPYILAENPGMSRQEAFAISKRMMMGQKWNVFVLDLSFLGWRLLEGITFGIVGVFYVEPYYQATMAELYAFNRNMAYQQGYIR